MMDDCFVRELIQKLVVGETHFEMMWA